MHHLKTLLLLVAFACLSLHCKKEEQQKEEDKLPPLTAEGKQSFGCLMNGKAWPGNLFVDFGSSGYGKGIFELDFYTKDPLTGNPDEEVSIYIDHKIFGPGHYIIPFGSNLMKTNFVIDYHKMVYQSTITPDSYAIIDIIRLDTINHVMAGSFQFTLFNEFNWQALNVTKGRFDFKYLP